MMLVSGGNIMCRCLQTNKTNKHVELSIPEGHIYFQSTESRVGKKVLLQGFTAKALKLVCLHTCRYEIICLFVLNIIGI